MKTWHFMSKRLPTPVPDNVFFPIVTGKRKIAIFRWSPHTWYWWSVPEGPSCSGPGCMVVVVSLSTWGLPVLPFLPFFFGWPSSLLTCHQKHQKKCTERVKTKFLGGHTQTHTHTSLLCMCGCQVGGYPSVVSHPLDVCDITKHGCFHWAFWIRGFQLSGRNGEGKSAHFNNTSRSIWVMMMTL